MPWGQVERLHDPQAGDTAATVKALWGTAGVVRLPIACVRFLGQLATLTLPSPASRHRVQAAALSRASPGSSP